MKPTSSKLHVASRGARGSRRADFAARLKSRTRALRTRLDHRDAIVEAVRESNESLDPRKIAEWLVRQAHDWIPAPCWAVIAHDVNGQMNVIADVGLAPNLGPSVNEVSDEDKLPGSVAIDPISLLVAQSLQQPLKLVGVAMNVSNDVVFLVHLSPCG